MFFSSRRQAFKRKRGGVNRSTVALPLILIRAMFEVACLLAVFSVPIAIVTALSCMDDVRYEKATTVLVYDAKRE